MDFKQNLRSNEIMLMENSLMNGNKRENSQNFTYNFESSNHSLGNDNHILDYLGGNNHNNLIPLNPNTNNFASINFMKNHLDY